MAEITDKDGNIRRTDAKIQGDLFDLMMQMPQHKYEPRVFADYNEIVLEALRQFIKLWAFPEAGIPSKKQKGLFERWVSELQKLTDLCGSDAKLKLAMELAFKNYNGHLIKSPISIYSDLITSVSELNREEKKIIVKPEVTIEEKVASPEVVDASIKRMKNLLRKEDD